MLWPSPREQAHPRIHLSKTSKKKLTKGTSLCKETPRPRRQAEVGSFEEIYCE